MKKYITIVVILAVVSLLTACFSPWTGDSSITINLGRSMGRFDFEDESQIEGFEYTITLRGPGGTIKRHVKESGPVTFQVVPGSWTVDVRAIGDNLWFDLAEVPPSISKKKRTLRALGLEANIEVKAGVNKAVPLEMKSAMEVSNWKELNFAVDQANAMGKEEIIVIKNDIVVEDTLHIPAPFGVTGDIYKIAIISDGDVTIKRTSEEASAEPPYLDYFFEINMNGTLTLGKPGMTGTITLDGGWERGSDFPLEAWYSLISVNNSGTLVMNEGANLVNNNSFTNGGGVNVVEGNFIMNGGEISGNKANAGGGVSIEHDFYSGPPNGGTFTMNGGEISGNEADEGGGVLIYRSLGGNDEGGAFKMRGKAVISGNTSNEGGGGGVCNWYGIFNMSENAEISENNAFNGGGVYIWSGTFSITGGSITRNWIPEDSFGSGVWISKDSTYNENEVKAHTTGNFTIIDDEKIVDPENQVYERAM